MSFIIASIIITIISFFLFRKAAGTMSLLKPNVISVTYYLKLIGMTYIGLNLSLLGFENYQHAPASEKSLYWAYYSVSYTLIMMPLAMIFFQNVFWGGRIKSKIFFFYHSRLRPYQSIKDSAQIIFWATCTIVSALAILYCYYIVPSAPLISLVKGAPIADVLQLRIQVNSEFSGIIYIKNIFAELLTPIVSYVVYGYSKLYRNYKFRIWFYFTVLLSILALTFDVEKAPLVRYFVILFIIKGVVEKGLSKKILLVGVISMMGVILFLYSIFSDLTFNLYGGPLSRLIMVPNAGIRLSYDVFPDLHPFLMGQSLPGWMTGIFGMEHERSAEILMEVYNPEGIETSTAGVINTLYIAEAWANFGYIGLLSAPIIVGFVVQLIHNLVIKFKTPFTVALMAYFTIKLPILGGFVDFIWNVGWLFLLVLIFFSIQTKPILSGFINRRPNLKD